MSALAALSSAAVASPPIKDLGVIASGVTLSTTRPRGWRAVADSRLLVVIGLTGTGKSTAMAELRAIAEPFSLLPNRREVTDKAIIPLYSDQPVNDRVERFELTRRFARANPGGMAHILTQLSVDPEALPDPLVFDGLRGADEVAHAAVVLPRARFLVLTAPDFVRLTRIVLRADAFDRTSALTADEAGAVLSDAELLTPVERFQLEGWMRLGALDPKDVRAKLNIVTAERRNYDADLAIKVLMEAAPERTFVVDTSAVPPHLVGMIAARVLAS
ncbi:MAG TPA: hypothetical protein VNT30_25015 [Stellaceae bacterium]|nr:hypothetical protein [Stellaceae bacterium]